MGNINEFNIPAGNNYGYEILYFGVNLILMFDYRLAFDVEVPLSKSHSSLYANACSILDTLFSLQISLNALG
jgi:hypothetical protein